MQSCLQNMKGQVACLPVLRWIGSKRGTKSSNDRVIHFPSNDFSISRIASFLCTAWICVCVCVSVLACLGTGSSALSLQCFISIRTQRLGWAAVMWSQREIEINVSEPPWALRCYSRRASDTLGQMGNAWEALKHRCTPWIERKERE